LVNPGTLIAVHWKIKEIRRAFIVMKTLLTFLLLIICVGSFAQVGYKIDLKVKGLKDTTVFLAYSYGETKYIRDTAKVSSQGTFTFDGKEVLPQGIYFLVLKTTPLFEFVVSQQQHFSFETSTDDYVKNMKVKGDEDNRLFFENMVFNMERHLEAEPFVKILKDSTLKEDQKKDAREAFQKVNARVMSHQDEVIKNYPTTLTARFLKSSKQIDIPEAPKKADGSIDSTFQLRYYRKHYFDNFDLADDALIHLPKPVYSEKVNDYLDKLFIQSPDSLMAAIDGIVARAQKNQETFKYLVFICVRKYQTPTIMGLDEVYVRLVDKYFLSGAMDYWVGDQMKKNLKEYADKLRVSLVGKKGADLIMQDQNFQKRSLYEINKKYTVLFIFDPDCGHCREQSPKLVEFYNKDKARFNVEVFAVSLDTSMQKMRNYIKEMKWTWTTVNGPRSYVGLINKFYYAETTPSIYILDEKKKIIAKGLPVEKLEDFLINYEKYQQKKATQKVKGT
jgi:peroxiredoxin